MGRIILVAAASLGLASCGGTLFPGAGTMEIALHSTPAGADAITSIGPACRTPCTVAVPSPTDDFSVSFTLKGFQPMTIPVHITRSAGSLMTPPFTSLNPNPVVAQLQSIDAGSPRRLKRKRPAVQ